MKPETDRIMECKNCFEKRMSWNDCAHNQEWFEPRDIFFCSHQMIWFINALEYLEEDLWPIQPAEVARKQKVILAHAYFLTPREFLGEVMARLKTVSPDAKACLIEEITELHICDRKMLTSPARVALDYISGWRRRRKPFPEWRAQLKWKDKKR